MDDDDFSVEEEDVQTFKTVLDGGADIDDALCIMADAKANRQSKF